MTQPLPEGPTAVPQPYETLYQLAQDHPDLMYYIGMSNRPGLRLFLTRLEYEYFTPDTPKNDLLELRIVDWEKLTWAVLSIPAEYDNLAKVIANECGLRIANGIPIMFSSEGEFRFPVNGPNVFTIENVPNHWVYGNKDSYYCQEASAKEHQLADEIMLAHKVRYDNGEFNNLTKEMGDGA